MVQFQIQQDSEIPASNQLFNQIRFAIASRQYLPGHRLPSTRVLAMQTGLHRNTVNKVYRQLEETGLVEAQAGSGIFVRCLEHADRGSAAPAVSFRTRACGRRRRADLSGTVGLDGKGSHKSYLLEKYPDAEHLVRQCLNELLGQGCSLNEARELFWAVIDWRLRSGARVLVTAPRHDIGVGELMTQELEQALRIPMQLVPLEELTEVLERISSATVVTNKYFIGEAQKQAAPQSVRVIPVDIYDYAKEIQLVKSLPKDTCFGIVCLSAGVLRATEVIVNSLRGDDIYVMKAQPQDNYKLDAIVRAAQAIVTDMASYDAVKAAVAAAREDIIRAPRIYPCENYIDSKSIERLQRELGLD
ncbi:MAG: GntR family transcriptional regulator [Hormoscilla sp. SP5CHS1]|nr:GntR family transcriptional regulator [Hormoscilla sp. SP5CHS1]